MSGASARSSGAADGGRMGALSVAGSTGVNTGAGSDREEGACAATTVTAPRMAQARIAGITAARERRCRRIRRWGSSRPLWVGIMAAMVPWKGCQTTRPNPTGPLRDPRNLTTKPGATLGRDGPPRHRAARLPRRAGCRGRRPGAAGERLGRRRATLRAWTARWPVAGTPCAADDRELLPALHAVQDRVGWISQPALNYISRRLAVPPAEAYGVATFYALYATTPQPPTVAHVCDDIACRIAGAERICDDLRRAVGPEGEAARDGSIGWKRSPCLGPVRARARGHGDDGRRGDAAGERRAGRCRCRRGAARGSRSGRSTAARPAPVGRSPAFASCSASGSSIRHPGPTTRRTTGISRRSAARSRSGPRRSSRR